MNPNLKILTDAIEFIERNLENNVSLQKLQTTVIVLHNY